MKIVRWMKIIGALIITLALFRPVHSHAQIPPFPTDPYLDSWSFYDPTNWFSDFGYAPTGFTNIVCDQSAWSSDDGVLNCNGLILDFTNAAFLSYKTVQSPGNTNIMCQAGTIWFWFSPDWNSASASDDGTGGPGDWGRFVDVGAWTSNAVFGWWSLLTSPDGNNIYFSGQTNGASTNYLSYPISWTAGSWHLIGLTYTATNSILYVDGQFATNGLGVIYPPSQYVLTNSSFSIGSDGLTGMQQARGEFVDVEAWANQYSADYFANYYDYMLPELPGSFSRDSFSPPDFGSGGGGGSGFPDLYGTNLWLYIAGVQSNSIGLFLINTAPDILYEIQSKTDLTLTNWNSEGFVNGSEITNFTEMDLTEGDRTNNLFMRIRSWRSSDGSGIPDWWWLTYFGQITNVDSTVSAAGDGYSNWKKFQMGLDPTNYYNPNGLGGFFGCLDSTGTNVVIEWSPAPGPVVNYVIQRGILDTNGNYVYSQIGLVSSNAIFFKDVGAVASDWSDNSWNNVYNVWAVYADGSVSGTDSWTAYDVQQTIYGDPFDAPPYGAPMPENVYAYAPASGTNVLISWTAPAQGTPTNYIVERGVFDTTNFDYDYTPIASVNTNTTYFQDTGALSNTNVWNDIYGVVAVYAGGGLSVPATSFINTNLPAPTGVSATLDSTGTNVLIAWTPPQSVTVTNYIIKRGILNTNTGLYSYSQIASVSASATSFTDTGAITGLNSYNNAYEVEAVYPGGSMSQFALSYLPASSIPVTPTYNLYVTAQLIRNQTGHWQLMFSSIPTNVQAIALYWWSYDYFYDIGPYPDPYTYPYTVETDIPISSLTNGIYVIPDAMTTNGIADNSLGKVAMVQPIGTNSEYGNLSQAGFLPYDAPCFVDGQQHMKQNLLFALREATISQANSPLAENSVWFDPFFTSIGIPTDTNYVESSFFHVSYQYKGYGEEISDPYMKMDNLWPFTANYELHQNLYDPSNTVPSSFVWHTNLVTIPASAVLGISDPYWISQSVLESAGVNPATGLPLYTWNYSILTDLAAYTNSGSLFLQTGSHNLYGLAFETALVNQSPLTTVAPGSSTGLTNTSCFYSQTADPILQLVNYYFAPVLTPGTAMPGNLPNQLYPLPSNPGFAVTNQTALMIASIGNPIVIGSWAKYAITNGSSSKFAYLGQYFMTNAYLMSAGGTLTTNKTGVVSPYGDFFPTEPGAVAMITTPDIDTGVQATGVVDVVSLNVDANHDGTMDFKYNSPDFVSSSKPFRFWVNDDQDAFDDYGDGIPQDVPWYVTDGFSSAGLTPYSTLPMLSPVPGGFVFEPFYRMHGTRDLVDYFPVYLNIGSLFQSNALSAGISMTDTNYFFILSQADNVLRFVYTDLTPTNYMNFLRDTNEARSLADAVAWPVDSRGVPLSQSFVAGIATNNQGVILVEAATNTTQPLVLTIYHGTNQIAQTSLPLSISGVEQMFRSKTMLLNTNSQAVADRLTDASVPNEPDTIDKNFVFLHGYNVNPQQARGWFADFYKRMYWSGSHAKFYGVTWEASDSQILSGSVTINLQTNIVNAFLTASNLATFIGTLPNETVVAAHSLGNMTVLSALNDCTNISFNISKFFMIDAAVPIEAIQGSATPDSHLYYPDWTPYADKLNASHWWNLFPTNDARSTLTWNNRLENFGDTEVYNVYSSGEEVLREYTDNSGYPPSELVGSLDQVKFYLENEILNIGKPVGTYTWAWEEMLKGRGTSDNLLSSTHGGWKFNTNAPYAYVTNGVITEIPNSSATLTSTSQLQTNAFFDVTSSNFGTADLALFGTSGSTYAQTHRNRILSDAIPALTLPLGANPVPGSGIVTLNLDMQTIENGWPSDRPTRTTGASAAGEWHHSDCRQVAYTFTHNLFDDIATFGGLQ